jgi:amidase
MPDSQKRPLAQEALAVLVDSINEDRESSFPINAVTRIFVDANEQALKQDLSGAGALTGWVSLVKACIPCGPELRADAGSVVLEGVVHAAEAPIIGLLRDAGCVVAGQTAMSEWSGMRSTSAPSGWSPAGGQVRNPRGLGSSPWGSSSGSAAAVAAGWVRLAIGTDTSGSVTLPAAANGIVGMRPTKAGRSLDGAIGISPRQDRPGFLTRDVSDLATFWEAFSSKLVPKWRGPTRIALVDVGSESIVRMAILDWKKELANRSWDVREVDSDLLRKFCIAPDELDVLTDEFARELEKLVKVCGDQINCSTSMELLDKIKSEPREFWDLLGGDIFETACHGPRMSESQLKIAQSDLEKSTQAILSAIAREGDTHAIAFVVPLTAWRIDELGIASHDPGCVYPTIAPCVASWPQVCIPIAVEGPPVGVILAMPPGRDDEVIALALEIGIRENNYVKQ